MKKIITIGEILVEIMADTTGEGFLQPIALTGPYPSGAPAIYIAQAARIGQPCGMISAVGDDDFGRLNLNRLAADGVDISAIAIDPERPTGSAFVRYRPDGARDFVFNIAHSATASIRLTDAGRALIAGADHLHLVGTSLAAPAMQARALTVAGLVKAQGGSLSFDPNLRKELLHLPGVRDTALSVLALTDLFLPSGEEVYVGTEAPTEAAAVAAHLARGVRAVVLKRGAAGASYHDPETALTHPGFKVTEVDPTGAGDCFGAAFTALWLRGTPAADALRLACAAGALAVTRRGPMEGVGTLAEIRAFAASNPET